MEVRFFSRSLKASQHLLTDAFFRTAAFNKFMHTLLGLYMSVASSVHELPACLTDASAPRSWEFITSLPFDWEYISGKRKFKWPMVSIAPR